MSAYWHVGPGNPVRMAETKPLGEVGQPEVSPMLPLFPVSWRGHNRSRSLSARICRRALLPFATVASLLYSTLPRGPHLYPSARRFPGNQAPPGPPPWRTAGPSGRRPRSELLGSPRRRTARRGRCRGRCWLVRCTCLSIHCLTELDEVQLCRTGVVSDSPEQPSNV